jgi:hypothetical protein
MGPVGHAGGAYRECVLETEARLSSEVAAHALSNTQYGISGQPAPEEINLAWEGAAA